MIQSLARRTPLGSWNVKQKSAAGWGLNELHCSCRLILSSLAHTCVTVIRQLPIPSTRHSTFTAIIGDIHLQRGVYLVLTCPQTAGEWQDGVLWPTRDGQIFEKH